MLLDRRKVKFWQKIVFGFMAFLMAAFLVVGYSGVLNGCSFFNATKSATEELQKTLTQYQTAVATNPQDATSWTKLGDNYVLMANQQSDTNLQKSYWQKAIVAYKKADTILAKQKGSAVKALDLDGVAATEANVVAGKYTFQRSLYVLTNGAPAGEVDSFIKFLTGNEGQTIVKSLDFIVTPAPVQ